MSRWIGKRADVRMLGSSIIVENNVAHINGVKKLSGMTLVGSDLRSSAALIIAALISKSTSHIYGLEHLDRGYENFELKLSQLGVQITREESRKIIRESKFERTNSKEKDLREIKVA